MKYAFNGFLFSQRPTGVMRFAKEILLRIDEMCLPNEFVLVIPEYADNYPKLSKINTVKYGFTKGNLWEQIDFAKYIKRNNLVSVNFNNTMPLLSPGIIVIHDIAYKIHPEFSDSLHGKISNIYHRIIFRRAAKCNVPIITVTHFSKFQLIDCYKINPKRITVIGNAWQHFENIGTDETILDEYDLSPKSYYFSLGSISKMKNTQWFVDIAKKRPNDLFVLAGARPKNSNLKVETIPNVKTVGFVTDEQIKSLIKNCKAFIYPSIFDGFGIPPLEALSQGATVICSCAACLPEVFGGSVHYIDPYNTDVDLESLILEEIDSPATTLDKYSWDKSARRFYNLLK